MEGQARPDSGADPRKEAERAVATDADSRERLTAEIDALRSQGAVDGEHDHRDRHQ